MVFVLDRRKRPLMPCPEKRARKLLAAGRARIHRLLQRADGCTDNSGGAAPPQAQSPESPRRDFHEDR
ncbi:MAG: RRXRR domain-containing protein [Candidatus Schekmanbacteria bacterium]|nr:RRXRR domain-containing protein [Candidatus Schekmanbacteria bacterium]